MAGVGTVRVGPFRSPQLPLFELGPDDWLLYLRLPEYAPVSTVQRICAFNSHCPSNYRQPFSTFIANLLINSPMFLVRLSGIYECPITFYMSVAKYDSNREERRQSESL